MERLDQEPQDELLRSLYAPKKKSWEKEIEAQGYDVEFKVITEKERPYIDFSHKVVVKERDFANLFRYIKSLKKQIAKLKKIIENQG